MLSAGDIKDIERVVSKRGSILSDITIRDMIRRGKLIKTEPIDMSVKYSGNFVDPANIPCEYEDNIQPASFDITVGNSFTVVSSVPNGGII